MRSIECQKLLFKCACRLPASVPLPLRKASILEDVRLTIQLVHKEIISPFQTEKPNLDDQVEVLKACLDQNPNSTWVSMTFSDSLHHKPTIPQTILLLKVSKPNSNLIAHPQLPQQQQDTCAKTPPNQCPNPNPAPKQPSTPPRTTPSLHPSPPSIPPQSTPLSCPPHNPTPTPPTLPPQPNNTHKLPTKNSNSPSKTHQAWTSCKILRGMLLVKEVRMEMRQIAGRAIWEWD